MALSSATPFASFDINDGNQIRDISPILQEALYFDHHLLGALNVDFGNPVEDIIHYWNEDILNSDTVTVSGSVASTGTSITLASGHGGRVHIGDLFYDTKSGSTEIGQVTDVPSTDTLTVTRHYNSTTAASIADAATLAVFPAEQEGSNIGSDKSVAPRVRTNYTQIFAGRYDLMITGSQLARRMSTTALADQVAHQLANRAVELKISMARSFLYSEPSAAGGSDTAYRTMAGIRSFINSAGIKDSSATALSYANLNTYNKSPVDLGVYPNLLVVGTDLVGSIAGYDSSNRRLLESDRQAGYTVQEIVLNQGNSVRVVVDGRVKGGDAFLLDSSRWVCRPLAGRGMFTIAAVDFTDARKRRVLAEWTMEARNPESQVFLSNKT